MSRRRTPVHGFEVDWRVYQSRTILGTSNIKTSPEHNFIQFVLENDINDREAHVIDLLAWAFIGRIIALPTTTPDVNRQSVLLQYDVQGDQLTIKRDSCQVDKMLYNTMVLGSVTLLIFFISAMVVEKKRHEKQDQVSPKTPAHEPEKVPGKTDSLMPCRASESADVVMNSYCLCCSSTGRG